MCENDRLLCALRRNNIGRPPIWIMRQAGRYLPEYRALREKHTFLEMCHRPELIAQVTQLPFRRFAFDAAILFSDILIVTEAIGKAFTFIDGKGPMLDHPLKTAADVNNLPTGDMAALECVGQGIQLLKSELQVPLIGFCGGPFTVASYLIEGGTSRDWRQTKRWLFSDPDSFHALLRRLTDVSIEYLKGQIAAGVDVIQIFDSWAHVLAYPQFCEFSLAYLRRIVTELGSRVPIILFCRGSCLFSDALAALAPAGIGLDWTGEVATIRARLGAGIALQGNLDPDLLYAPLQALRGAVTSLLEAMRHDPAYIVNLGHGIAPDAPLDSVSTLLDCVHAS